MHLWVEHIEHEPYPKFRESRRCTKVCLSNLMQKTKKISVQIFGLLKPTKALGCCEVFPSLPFEKATNNERKFKSLEKAHSKRQT